MSIFNDQIIGLDISDNTIEMVGLSSVKDKYNVVQKKRILLPPGIVEGGEIKNEAELSKFIKQLINTSKPIKITFGLPDRHTFIHIHELEPGKKALPSNEINEIVRKNIPIDEKNMVFSYSLLKAPLKPRPEKGKNKSAKKMDQTTKTDATKKLQEETKNAKDQITEDQSEKLPNRYVIVATTKSIFEHWQKFFKKNNITITVDIESLAVFRGLYAHKPSKPVAVIDMGAVSTNVGIYDQLGLAYTFSSTLAGNQITQQISQGQKISIEEAEKQKIAIGLANKTSPIGQIIQKQIDDLCQELLSQISFYQQHSQQTVSEIVLVGGSCKMPGLLDYMGQKLGKPTKIGQSAVLAKATELEYVEAIGLALRGFSRPQDSSDPILQTRAGLGAGSGLNRSVLGGKKSNTNAETDLLSSASPLATPEDIQEIKKFQNEKKLFVAISILGLIIILLMVWYQYKRNREHEAGLQKTEAEQQQKPAPKKAKPQPTKTVSDKKEATSPDATKSADIKPLGKITINKTSAGYLRVRADAGTAFDEVGRVKAGETYEILAEKKDWYEIQLKDKDATKGWVFKAFVTKKAPLDTDQEASPSTKPEK